MNIKYLTSFLTAADEGSINMAASALFLSPSALLKQVNSVEQEIGTALLRRGKKGVELTEAGKTFYEGLRELLPAYEELVRQTRQVGQRSARMLVVGSWSVPCHVIIPSIVNYYRIRHPEVELVFRNIHGIEDIQGALERREIDVTFTFGGRSKATARTRCVELAREEPVVLLPPDCDVPLRREYTLADFEGRSLVVTDGSVSGWFERFNAYVGRRHPTIRLHPATENESGLMDMQKLSAPCVASRSIVPRDSRYTSAPLCLPEDFGDARISMDLVCRKDSDPLIQDFVRAAGEAAKVIWASSSGY